MGYGANEGEHPVRRWSSWPKRFGEEANATSGIFALGGAGVAAGGLIFAAPAVAIGGVVLFAGTAVWCAAKALPPQQRAPQHAVGDKFENLAELRQFAPPLRRVGFLGASKAGKTTLLMHVIAQKAPSDVRTDDPYAMVTALVGKPPRYFALIDAAGQQFSQQFKVADESDYLIICLDHTSDDHISTTSADRLRQHEIFLQQMLGHLKTSGKSPSALHFLLNKRDLWQTSSDRVDLERWFAEQVDQWSIIPGLKVTSSHHSNFKADDITAMIDKLRQLLK